MSLPDFELNLPPGLPRDDRATVVTVGTFDGVHRGHRAVLEEISRRAQEREGRSVLVTFHPHPLRIVRPEHAPPLLTTPAEKKEILAESGLHWAVFLPFTEALSRLAPREFVERILVGRIGVTELVIGYDHGFGHGRAGDADLLREIGREFGFSVDVVPPVEVGGEAVSSSGIRRAVAAGDLGGAAAALGRPYAVRGIVVRGDGRGRTLGFPTANLHVGDPDKLLPPPGIYAVHVAVRRLGTVPGALHLGPRPTFQGSPPSVEVYLLDWSGDLYGEEVRLDFVRRIRDVLPFRSAAALVDQMKVDVEEVRRVLDTGP